MERKYYAINIVITFLFVLLKYYALNILKTTFVFVGTKVLCYEHLLVPIIYTSMTTADVGLAYLSIQ